MPVRAVVATVMCTSLILSGGAAVAHNQAFSDPDDSIRPADLKRVAMSHDGGRYTFKATTWDNFSNRSMGPSRGVSWELDTMDAVGEFDFDHQVVLNWMRHNGRRQYRCRVYRHSTGGFVGNFPGSRNDRTVKCPNIPDSKWGNRDIYTWNVLSLHEGSFDSAGPYEH